MALITAETELSDDQYELNYVEVGHRLPPLNKIVLRLYQYESLGRLALGLKELSDHVVLTQLAEVLPRTRVVALRIWAEEAQLHHATGGKWLPAYLCVLLAALPRTRIGSVVLRIPSMVSGDLAMWARSGYFLTIETLEIPRFENMNDLFRTIDEDWLPSLQRLITYDNPVFGVRYTMPPQARTRPTRALLSTAAAALQTARTPAETAQALRPLDGMIWDVRHLWPWIVHGGEQGRTAYAHLLRRVATPTSLSDWDLWVEHARLKLQGLRWTFKLHYTLPVQLRRLLHMLWSVARVRPWFAGGAGLSRLSWPLLARLSRFVLSAELKPGFNARLEADAFHNLNVCGPAGHTPLSRAARQGDKASWLRLLSHPGIDVNAYHRGGLTPLQVLYLSCTRHQALDLMQHLCRDPRLNPNKRSAAGLSTMELCLLTRDIRFVRMLLALPQLDVSIRSKDGLTALETAARSAGSDIIALLRADPRIQRLIPVLPVVVAIVPPTV